MHELGQIRNKFTVRYKWSVRWSIYNAYKKRWTGGWRYLTEKKYSGKPGLQNQDPAEWPRRVAGRDLWMNSATPPLWYYDRDVEY